MIFTVIYVINYGDCYLMFTVVTFSQESLVHLEHYPIK